jgi:hypothetical protein
MVRYLCCGCGIGIICGGSFICLASFAVCVSVLKYANCECVDLFQGGIKTA